jgi:hypothetical protein
MADREHFRDPADRAAAMPGVIISQRGISLAHGTPTGTTNDTRN